MAQFSILGSRLSVLGSRLSVLWLTSSLALVACGANNPTPPADVSLAETATLEASSTSEPVPASATVAPTRANPGRATSTSSAGTDPSATVTAVAVVLPSATLAPSPEPTTLVVRPSVPTGQATPASGGLPPLVPSEETIPAEALPAGLLDTLKSDLATRTGVAVDAILFVSAEFVIWNDGSLGCPEPGVSYIQILIEGYRVILSADGTNYDYRTGRGDEFILCER